MAAGRTLIRRYALALTPAGAGNEAAVTATAVPPLGGGPGEHGSEATHAVTITDSVGRVGSHAAAGEPACQARLICLAVAGVGILALPHRGNRAGIRRPAAHAS